MPGLTQGFVLKFDFSPAPLRFEKNEEIVVEQAFLRCVLQRFFQNKSGVCGFALLVFMVVMAIIGPHLTPYTYFENHLALNNLPPCQKFWFGTDDLGRDLFTRIWYGARISLFVGMSAALIDVVLGVLYGGASALLAGRLDDLMMRIADVIYSIPYLLIVIMLMVVLGSGLLPIIIALTFTGWINMARVVRSQVLQMKTQCYVLAAKSFGSGFWRILLRHMIPGCLPSIIVTMMLTIPGAIFTEAFLSFLGLGVQAPIASWGTMASDGLPALRYYPWRLFFPAFFISMTLLAFHLVGDAFSSAFDEEIRGVE